MFYCFSILWSLCLVCLLPFYGDLCRTVSLTTTPRTITNVLVVCGLFWLLLSATDDHTQNYKTKWNTRIVYVKTLINWFLKVTACQHTLRKRTNAVQSWELPWFWRCDLFYMNWWQLIGTNGNVCEVFDIDISYVIPNDTASIAISTGSSYDLELSSDSS